MNTLIERISFLLEKADNSVTALANIAGVKPPSVSDWLNGKTKTLKSASAIRLAKHFGVNVLWLTEGVGPMASDDHKSETEPGPKRLAIRRALFKLSAGVSGYEIEYENGENAISTACAGGVVQWYAVAM